MRLTARKSIDLIQTPFLECSKKNNYENEVERVQLGEIRSCRNKYGMVRTDRPCDGSRDGIVVRLQWKSVYHNFLHADFFWT